MTPLRIDRDWPKLIKKVEIKKAPATSSLDDSYTGKCVAPTTSALVARNAAIVVKAGLSGISPQARAFLNDYMLDRAAKRLAAAEAAEAKLQKAILKSPKVELAKRLHKHPDLLRPAWPDLVKLVETPEQPKSRQIEWSLVNTPVLKHPIDYYAKGTYLIEAIPNPFSGRVADSMILKHSIVMFHCQLSDAEVSSLSYSPPFPLQSSSNHKIVVGEAEESALALMFCPEVSKFMSKRTIRKLPVDPIYLGTAGILVQVEYKLSLAWQFAWNFSIVHKELFLTYKITLMRPTIEKQNDIIDEILHSAETEKPYTPRPRSDNDWCLLYEGAWLAKPVSIKSIKVSHIRVALESVYRRHIWNLQKLNKSSKNVLVSRRNSVDIFGSGCDLTQLPNLIRNYAVKKQRFRLFQARKQIEDFTYDWCVMPSLQTEDLAVPESLITAVEWTGHFTENRVILSLVQSDEMVITTAWTCTCGSRRDCHWMSNRNVVRKQSKTWEDCVKNRSKWAPPATLRSNLTLILDQSNDGAQITQSFFKLV